MIVHIGKLDLQFLMSWLKTLLLQQDTQKAYPHFPWSLERIPAVAPWQIEQQWKIRVKEHNAKRYILENEEQDLVYGVANGKECVFKSPELTAGIIYW